MYNIHYNERVKTMVRTQIQIPDELYRRAKKVAKYREVSLAELLRRGLEYMIAAAPERGGEENSWSLPEPVSLGGGDPFAADDWRERLYMDGQLRVAEEKAEYNSNQDR